MARPPERRKRIRLIGGELDIDLDVSTCVEANRVDDPKAEAVEEETPGCPAPPGVRDRDAPQRIVRRTPRHHDQRDRRGAAAGRSHRRILEVLPIERLVEPEEPDERRRGCLEERAGGSRWTEISTRAAQQAQARTCVLQSLRAGDRLDVGLEKTAADKVAVEPRNHDAAVSTSSSVGRSVVIVAAVD